jgi:hypothetical protein
MFPVKTWLLLLELSALMPLLLLGCVGQDAEDASDPSGQGTVEVNVSEAVEQTVTQAVGAYNRQDAALFLSLWTDAGLREEFGASREEILQRPQDLFGGPPRMLRGFENTKVSADKATTEAEFTFGRSVQREKLELVKDGALWKIAGSEQLTVKIPSGTTAVDVDMKDYAFFFDPAKTAGGDIAFKAKNVGSEPHELVVLKVPAAFNLQQALQSPSPELPAGIEIIGGLGPLEPDKEGNLVFLDRLEVGRYLMVCFLPVKGDPQGTPHVVRGMVSEFNVTPQGGGR